MPRPSPDRPLAIVALIAVLGTASPGTAQGPAADLTVHEWGTFTSLLDEGGHPISGINSDDEPVPDFVHAAGPLLIQHAGELAASFFQGAPRCHPDVTMRLETPVVYFHPGPSRTEPFELDVRVRFPRGWLTEFYPLAEVVAPGIDGPWATWRIADDAVGSLAWEHLTVGGDWTGPETDEHVWLAPRRVDCAPVRAANGESERYLFYRGVGNVAPPVSVAGDAEGRLVLTSRLDAALAADGPLPIGSPWLVDVADDGRVAYRRLPALALGAASTDPLATFQGEFTPEEYSAGGLPRLRRELHAALVADGLFADEAEALLATWELSYFQSAGLRLFFLAPRAWTDAVLPIELSEPAELVRSMVARIELVTPRQRALLARLAESEVVGTGWFHDQTRAQLEEDPDAFFRLWERVVSGRSSLVDEGFELPACYRSYLALGRFRDALVLDELDRRPTERLAEFARVYAIERE